MNKTNLNDMTMDDLNKQEAQQAPEAKQQQPQEAQQVTKKQRKLMGIDQARQVRIDRLRRAMFEIKQLKALVVSPIHVTAEYLDVQTDTVYGWLSTARAAQIPKFKLKAIEGYAAELQTEYQIKYKKPFVFNLDNNEEEW